MRMCILVRPSGTEPSCVLWPKRLQQKEVNYYVIFIADVVRAEIGIDKSWKLDENKENYGVALNIVDRGRKRHGYLNVVKFVSQYHLMRVILLENRMELPETKVDVNFQLLQHDQISDLLNGLSGCWCLCCWHQKVLVCVVLSMNQVSLIKRVGSLARPCLNMLSIWPEVAEVH